MKTPFILFLAVILHGHLFAQSVEIRTIPNGQGIIEAISTTSGIAIPKMTTTQREAIISPQKGLLVFDQTTNSNWYHNGTGWVQLTIGSNSGQWQVSSTNQYNVNSDNVGVGINPMKAKFEVNSAKQNQAIFGSNGAGISFQADNPGIGFNTYKDSTNTAKYLSNGYALSHTFDKTTGNMAWNLHNYGTKDNILTNIGIPVLLKNNGNFGIGTGTFGGNPVAKLDVNGFSKFGSDSPRIKYEVFTGTTTDATSSTTSDYNHYSSFGLKVYPEDNIKISVIMDCGGTFVNVPPNQCDSFYSGYCYRVDFKSSMIEIFHEGYESRFTYSKPVKVTVVYQD